jgi:hypothetical protein
MALSPRHRHRCRLRGTEATLHRAAKPESSADSTVFDAWSFECGVAREWTSSTARRRCRRPRASYAMGVGDIVVGAAAKGRC